MKLMFFIFSSLMLLGTSMKVQAGYSCSFDLRYGVAVSDDHIRVLKQDRTVVQINRARYLFIEGKLKRLDQEQQDLLYAYARGFHDVVPEVTLLAKEGVGLVTDNITRIYSGLVGAEVESAQRLLSQMKKVKEKVKHKFGRSYNYYYINPSKVESEDDITTSLEAQLETGFSNVSGIVTAIGTFDSSSETEQTSELRKRAHITCKKLYKLNKLEDALLSKVRGLTPYDVIIDRRSE
ncbi:DUF2884 family protein [Alteromonas sediminis]|nr:DUF2884 family protein [Alteromonas sediminis]